MHADADGALDFTDRNVYTTGLTGGGVVTKSTSANYTIGTTNAYESYGGVIYADTNCVVTAPNAAAGMSFSVITIGSTWVCVDVNSTGDRMYLDGTELNFGHKASNTTTTGDSIVCTYYDPNGWYCMSGSPDGDNWSDGG